MWDKSFQKRPQYRLIQQALFGQSVAERISGIIGLSRCQEPEIGYLLEKILEEEK